MRYHAASGMLLAVVVFATGASSQGPVDPAQFDSAFLKLAVHDAGGDAATVEFITAYVDRATGRYKIRVDAFSLSRPVPRGEGRVEDHVRADQMEIGVCM